LKDLKLKPSSRALGYAETMRIDEGGVELLIDGEIENCASFDGLDLFEIAYRVLPEDFELSEDPTVDLQAEQAYAADTSEDNLESLIWIYLQELAKQRGYGK
jgi:hypothetical protein